MRDPHPLARPEGVLVYSVEGSKSRRRRCRKAAPRCCWLLRSLPLEPSQEGWMAPQSMQRTSAVASSHCIAPSPQARGVVPWTASPSPPPFGSRARQQQGSCRLSFVISRCTLACSWPLAGRCPRTSPPIAAPVGVGLRKERVPQPGDRGALRRSRLGKPPQPAAGPFTYGGCAQPCQREANDNTSP